MNTRKLFLKTYRILNLLLIFIMSFGSPLGTLAQVWTDPVDYPPGSEVWIQGDNSNGAAYQLGEVVRVDVVGPLGADGIPYQAACEDVVEEPDPENRPGYYYWTCQVMLWDSVYAVGEYVYTATGLSSGEIETGIFTDGPANYISLDFVASAPLSYDHATGGGAFDDRTVGKSADIVESLEGGDFKCGDVATFLLEIDLDGTQKSPEMPRTARFLIDFTLDTTGQTGLALGPVSYVGINYTPVQDLIPGEDGVDQGMVDDGGSTATLISQTAPTVTEPPYFTPGQVNRVEIQVTDLEYSENVILRVDAKIACKFGSSPTGNLQAAIYSGTVIRIGDSIVAAENIPVGQQTVPFKASEDVIFPGVIIVDKVTDPSVAPDLFDFKVSAPGGPLSMPYLQTFQLADQTPPWNSGNIDPSYAAIGNTITLVEGSYTVEEISPLPNGWEFTNGTCVNQFNEIQGTVGQSVTFDLNENEVVTCTFYNTRNYNQDLTVTKTATAAKQRTYNWLIDKSVDDTLIEIAEGGKATFNYTVDVTPNGFTDSVWVVTGKITVNNPNSFDVAGVNVTDSINNGGVCTVTNGTGVMVPANSSVELDYSCTYASAPTADSGTNTATATWDAASYYTPNGSASGTAGVDFSVVTPSEVNKVITVVDDKTDPLHPVTLGTSDYFTGPFEFTYSLDKQGVAGTCTDYTNTAVIDETDQSDSQTVTVCVGKNLTVTKTAAGAYNRTYHWKIDKSVDDTLIEIAEGDTATFNYTVKVTPDGYTDSGWMMGGTITVSNPNDWEDITADVTDAFDGGTCTVAGGEDVVIPAGGSVTLSYSCTFASQPIYTGTNTATATWDAAAYFTPSSTATGSADVTLSLNGEKNRTITVVDDQTDPANPVTLGTSDYYVGPFEFTYSLDKQGVAGDCTDYTNTAVIDETEQFDSQTVTVCVGKDLTVTKTATASLDRTYKWLIDKSVDDTRIEIAEGGIATFNYDVTVTPNGYTDSGWVLGGTITINNPNDWEDITVSVADFLDQGGMCTITEAGPYVAPKSGSLILHYTCTTDGTTTKNTVNVTWDKGTYFTPTGSASADAAVSFALDVETNATITVVDDKTDPIHPVTLGTWKWADGAHTFEYSLTKSGIAGVCTDYTNTAVIDETDQFDSQTVTVCVGKDLTVTKTAVGTFDRTYKWLIDKSVDDTLIEIAEGGLATFNYTVKVTPDGYTDSGWTMGGTITVSNPNDWEDITADVTDTFSGGGTCTVAGGEDVVIPAGKSVTLDYSCAFTGQPTYTGTNTATATWDAAAYFTPTGTASGEANTNLALKNETYRTVTVVDDKTDPLNLVTLGSSDYVAGPFVYTYSLDKQGEAGTCTDYTNTAVIDETDQSDSQTVTVCVGKDLTVTKTAAGLYNRTYFWTIDKSVDDTLIEIAEDGTATFNYTVDVTPNGYTDSGWTMGGTITVSNPNDWEDISADVTDAFPGGVCTVAGGEDVVIPAGESVTLNYSCAFASQPTYTGTNTATATWDAAAYFTPSGTATGSADVTLGLNGETNRTITVVDDQTDPANPVTLGSSDYVAGPFVYTYSLGKQGVAGVCTDYTNTAVIDETEQSDSQTVTVCVGKDLTVTKTATPTFTRTWNWDITKDWDATYNLFAGGSVIHDYKVTVTPTSTDSAWKVVGTITINNPNTWQDIVANVSDAVDNGGTCVVDDESVTVPASGSVDVGYTCTFASMPTNYTGTNTATVTWDKALYFTPNDTATGTQGFEFTNPTEIDPVITVDDNNLNDESWSANRAYAEWTYTKEFACSTNPADYAGDGMYSDYLVNTAEINETGQTDTARVDVNCYAPVVTKTAAGTYDERHEWDVEKTVNPLSQSAFAGDTVSYEWTVTVTEDVFEENFLVAGEITVVNPAPMEMTVALADALGGGTVAVIGTCTNGTYADGKLIIPANTTATCAYTAEPAGRTDTVNDVTATLNGIGFDALATFGWTANVIRGSATLDDDQNSAFPLTLTDGGTWKYSESYTCSTDKSAYDATTHKYTFGEYNLAIVTSGGAEQDRDDASTAVDCYVPSISKTAAGTYDEVHDWDVFKTVNTALQTAFAGEKKNFTWTVRVDETTHGESYLVTGDIVVVNPNPEDALTVVLTDALDDGSVATIGPCTGGTWSSPNLTVPPSGTANCDYTVTPKGDMVKFATALPTSVTINSINPGPESYWLTTVSNGGALNGIYEAWCVDIDHTMNPGTNYSAAVYSSYEAYPSGLIEKAYDLDLVNWIINQDFVGKSAAPLTGIYTYGDVQRAIWEIIEDNPTATTSGLGTWNQARVDQIEALARANGQGFIPTCGDFVAVLLVPDGGQQPIAIAQVTFASLGLSCADSNSAKATLNGIEYPASAQILWTVNKINETASLDDDQKLDWPTTVSADTVFQYTDPQGYTCSTNPAAYTNGYYQYNESNTAILTYQTGYDTSTASTAVRCYAPVVTKTATGAYDERHEWDVEKTVNPLSQSAFAGDQVSYEWTVTVIEDVYEENFVASGTISVKNPRPDGGNMLVKLSDVLSDGFMPTITGCTNGTWDAVNQTVSIPAYTTAVCAYTASLTYNDDTNAPTNNTVTAELMVGTTHLVTSASAALGWNANVIRGSATLDDDQNPTFPLTLTDGGTWKYSEQYTCSTTRTDYGADSFWYEFGESNTATITSGDASDSSTVSTVVNCYIPEISKTAAGTYDERHEWDVTKTVTPLTQSAFAGDTVSYDWTVDVTESVFEESFVASGTITLVNHNPEDAMTVALSDVLNDNTAVTITACTGDVDLGDGLTIAAGDTSVCDYTAELDYDAVANAPTDNTATAVLNGISYSASDPIEWAVTVINDSASLDDDQNPLFPLNITDGGTWTYSENFTCSTDRNTYLGDLKSKYTFGDNNTATVTWGGFSDRSTASTSVDCYWPADAKVVKVTAEGPSDIGQFPFTFELYNPSGTKVETKTLNAAGEVAFATELKPGGTWKIVEVLPAGWVNTDASLTCSFTVDYWADAGKTYTCTFHNREMSRINVKKTTQGAINPSMAWTFSLFAGPDGFGSTPLATASTAADLDGVLTFNNVNLDRVKTYTLCENNVAAGWSSVFRVDTDGDGDLDLVIPYNPDADNPVPDDLGNRCVDFGAGVDLNLLRDGETLLFEVDNTYPGGEPRTPGYWKNWNTCTGGGQAASAAANGGWAAGFWLLDDVLAGMGQAEPIVWDDILADSILVRIDTCQLGVTILSAYDTSGINRNSDGAYTLAKHLLAAQANYGAGARTCDAASDAMLAAEKLLDKYNFNATAATYLPSNSRDKTIKADYALALSLAATLDKYNNGLLCLGPSVTFKAPLDGDVVSGDAVTLWVDAYDTAPVIKVEFFLDDATTPFATDTDGNDQWIVTWNLAGVADGSHTIRAVATNAGLNTGSGDVTITVDNDYDPPVVTILNPVSGAEVSGSSVSVAASAYSLIGVTNVEFFVNGASVGVDSDGSDGWSVTWNSTGFADGTYSLTAAASDGMATGTSAAVTILVNNLPDPTFTASLVGSKATVNKTTWKATVTITLNPALAGAVVTGNWGGSAVTCTTGADGKCTFSTNVSTKTGSITFNLTNIKLTGYVYVAPVPAYITISKP